MADREEPGEGLATLAGYPSAYLVDAELAVARLEPAAAAQPGAFVGDLAWALNSLANARGIAGDRVGALIAIDTAVSRLREYVDFGGSDPQAAQDLVYLLCGLSHVNLRLDRVWDAERFAGEACERQLSILVARRDTTSDQFSTLEAAMRARAEAFEALRIQPRSEGSCSP